MICPTCKGSGRTGPVHVNMGDKPHVWHDDLPCRACDGTGHVSEEQHRRMEAGAAMRKARFDRGESLREAARRMGISPAQLSAMERGDTR